MRLFVAVIMLALAPLSTHAQGTKDSYTVDRNQRADGVAGTRDTTLRDYVEANVTETLYHELAHALIDALGLPIYGSEEYAADMFAVVMLTRLHEPEEVATLAPLVTHNYLWFADRVGDHVDNLDLWDVHGPDLQRAYNFACLIYGAAPETHEPILQLVDLPEDREETCQEEYIQSATAWGAVLDRLATDAPGNSLRMDWIDEPDSHLARHVTRIVAGINATIHLPVTINVSVIPCGESNAFYDPNYTEIQICTELGEALSARAETLFP